MSIIEDIVNIEWNEITKIIKTDEKKKTFMIMRKSQFELWSQELLESYKNDLETAEYRGWNLITEKYARILKFTDFISYQNIEHMIPKVPEDTEELIDAIVTIQSQWMKMFERHYPRLASVAREIEVYEDEANEVSYEEMLKCELMTYSADTIMLYANMIIDYKKRNVNYIQKMMEITCRYHNFAIIDEAERNL